MIPPLDSWNVRDMVAALLFAKRQLIVAHNLIAAGRATDEMYKTWIATINELEAELTDRLAPA